MPIKTITGNILDQPVDAIVNPWNRNIIPWWLLLPQGVSGAIKKHASYQPFIELGKLGPIPLGQAVTTSAGKLPFKAIIHVAGINMLWRSSEKTIRSCVRSAITLAAENKFNSIAIPLIGAGTGGFNKQKAQQIILDELKNQNPQIEVLVVKFQK